jgi:hypothetical protein
MKETLLKDRLFGIFILLDGEAEMALKGGVIVAP